MTNPPQIYDLLPGDHLLYGVSDFFGRITSLKTWSPAVHIEVYIGDGWSVASRNGIGVNRYHYREKQLIAVLRPKQPMDLTTGLAWFNRPFNLYNRQGVKGRPYGWKDLARFMGLPHWIYQFLKTEGWICSQFAAKFDVACGFAPFAADYFQGSIDPGDYFVSPCFDWFWVEDETREAITS